MKTRMLFLAGALWMMMPRVSQACTGITLQTKDSLTVVARTIEWGGSYLASRYVVVPRGYQQRSYLPDGKKEGMMFESRYGYVGVAVEMADFVAEGINEAGLSAGLFYFPKYGGYEAYNPKYKQQSVSDLQLVSYVLSQFKTVDEVIAGLKQVHVISTNPLASTAHWRFVDESGRQVVLEIVDGELHFYENTIGVFTNSPDFEWQVTNLNNYVNLYPGAVADREWNSHTLSPFGAGSGMLGLPGDITPPSRFVRAYFYQVTAPQQATAPKTVMQAFQILNNFDIPVGVEFEAGKIPADIPSATQWTSATDIANRKFYFTSMYDRSIRMIDLKSIDFTKVNYHAVPIDNSQEPAVVPIVIE